jgi:protein tyrosine/serine phosphatase
LQRNRDLLWDGCLNVRDLGGHPTEDGGETRFGAVVRADSVRGLSEEGWEALVAYGVRRILDLRWHEELAEDPPRRLPVEVVHVPLLGEHNDATGREIDELVRDEQDPAGRRSTMYLEFLRRYPENFAAAVAAVGRAPKGAAVVHCAGGVDRTGLVSALLLRLAGVAPEHVANDYAASEANWAPRTVAWIAEAEDEDEREFRRFLARMPPEAMLGVLETLERNHGSVADYLRTSGIAEDDLQRARARLRG